jgi:hypothetical protein
MERRAWLHGIKARDFSGNSLPRRESRGKNAGRRSSCNKLRRDPSRRPRARKHVSLGYSHIGATRCSVGSDGFAFKILTSTFAGSKPHQFGRDVSDGILQFEMYWDTLIS